MERPPVLSTLGAVGAAVVSTLCCVGPLLYVSLGVGAGLASTFEPLRPWFLGAAALLLGTGFHRVYGRRPRCAPDGGDGRAERRAKALVWAGAVLVVVLATLPAWLAWFT